MPSLPSPFHRRPLTPHSFFVLSSAVLLSLSFSAVAQNASAVPSAVSSETTAVTIADSNAIVININGRTIESDPSPVLQKGAVLVPLRGVLENLGATVDYIPADRRIEITQNGKKVMLRLGEDTAIVDLQAKKLSAAPQTINGSTFVPMRSLAEIFGYRVAWLPPQRTVSITSSGTMPVPAEHRAALKRAGAFGVGINFSDASLDDVPILLDAAKKVGAGFIKVRFDWDLLEPTRGSVFQWSIYDRIVREARERNLVVMGILGNSARWASTLSSSTDEFAARNAPPREKEIPAWENFVRRTVGRYRQDVHAWQIWENPSSSNFRSSARNYRVVVRAGADAARQSDPKAIVFASEPGGVNLDFVEDLKRNGLTSRVSGVTLYPLSQWQPGVPARPEEFLLPAATLRRRLAPLGTDGTDLWVGGLSRPSLEASDLNQSSGPATEAGPLSVAMDKETRERLMRDFTPQAQADYLMRSSVLSLASGSDKVVWESLRDDATYETVQPINPERGSGLLKRDNTSRPAFAAFATMTKLLSGMEYVGALSLGPNAVGLVFSDKKTTHVAAWPLSGKMTIAVNHEGIDPKLPNSIFLPSLPTTKILDATGKELFGDQGAFTVENRPVWIADAGFEVPGMVKEKPGKDQFLLVQFENNGAEVVNGAGEVKAFFATGPDKAAQESSEAGIEWRKFAGFRGMAAPGRSGDGRWGLKTEFSRDIWNPAAGRPFVYLDVDDRFMFFSRGVPVRVSIEVHKAGPIGDPVSPAVAGFSLEYDSSDGPKRTPWQTIESGEGWTTYTFDLPNASFSNRGGFDLLINTWGAKQDVLFGSVRVQRLDGQNGTAPVVPVTPVTPITTAAAPPVGPLPAVQ
ncbi:MAG TPA: stalk domain-containing protein [Abditibacteriaceae bacterium]